MTGRILSVDPRLPRPEVLGEAVEVLRRGGVVAAPTISFYGLCADALNEAAFRKVLDIKGRPAEKALPLFIPQASYADRLAHRINPQARLLMERFWPGGLTLVLFAAPATPAHLASPEGKIGLRVPLHPIPLGLCALFNGPLTGTSANPAGAPPCIDAACVRDSLILRPDLILDGGSTPGTAGSTVVDMAGDQPRLLREGLVPFARLLSVLRGET